MKYESLLRDLEKINTNLCKLDFISYTFLYGSTSRMLVHADSDIDLILIGNREKNISVVSYITKFFDELELENEVDIKYYEFNNFCKLKETSLFLNKIHGDCKSIDNAIMDIKHLLERRMRAGC